MQHILHTTTIFIRSGAQYAFVTLIYSIKILSDIILKILIHVSHVIFPEHVWVCVPTHSDIENNKILNHCEEDLLG